MNTNQEIEFQGLYGNYRITNSDQIEVKKYRLSLLFCGISFVAGLNHWLFFGPNFAWIWLLLMSLSLGFALKWIHIYIQLLHKVLQTLCLIGSLGIILVLMRSGPENMLSNIASNPLLTLFVGPYFAALTGLGFKEFFCFRRPEAIGVTLFIPISLIGHIFGIINAGSVMILLCISAILFLILAIRKFGMDAASDIGDKSIFEYLKNNKSAAIT